MNIRELINIVGIPERQVRFLIAEGFVPPPRGGRANADYGEDHVVAITRYKRLHDLGFPPAAIRLLLGAREGVPIPIAQGVTLVIDPALIGSGKDPASLIEATRNRLIDLLQEKPNELAHDDWPS